MTSIAEHRLMPRRRCLVALALLSGIATLTACSWLLIQATDHPEQTQPNIVFILVDDMGFGDVGYLGSDIATPHLDRLARSGVQLNRNYVFPVCSPSRAALLTGHDPLAYGIDGALSDSDTLPVDLKIMPEYFKELGYQTIMVGKWHLGISDTDHWPISRGFDYFYGFLGGWVDSYTHVYTDGLDWQRNGMSVREDGHATDLLTGDAIDQIENRDPVSPMFMYLAYSAPHSPLQHPPYYSGLNDYPETTDRSVYAEMVTHLDASIGRVVAKLDSEELLDNTIIVFSSDNGGATRVGASNGELRGGKGSMFEGGTRVPGLLWWPGHVEGGQLVDQQITIQDWLPTLLDAVGAEPTSAIEPFGQSMWDAITNGRQVDRGITTMGVRGGVGVFDWPWKLVNQVRGEDQGMFLFNIVADPREQEDLSAKYPEKFDQLRMIMNSRPQVPSIANPPGSIRPEAYFRNPERGWDFDVRVPESRSPWAESANGFDNQTEN